MRIRETRNKVYFTGERKLSELPGFRQKYRPAEFGRLVSNRGNVLEDRLTFAYWAMSRSSDKDGKTTDVPLGLLSDALVAKWGKAALPRAQRARNWLVENGFLLMSNDGSYSIGNKSQTFYVNHAKIKAWVKFMRQRGILPSGNAWKRTLDDPTPKFTEKAVQKVEKAVRAHKSMMDWDKEVQAAVMGKKLHIPLIRKYRLTHAEQVAYIVSRAVSNTPIYGNVSAKCTEYSQLCRHVSAATNPAGIREGEAKASVPPYHLLSLYNPKIADSGSNSQEMPDFTPQKFCNFSEKVYNPLDLHCRPHAKIARNSTVTGVSFRVYSGAALLPSHNRKDHGRFEGSERQSVLDGVFGKGGYERLDRKCSISHLNYCLSMGRYFENGISDIYGQVYRKAFGCDLLPEERPAFKLTTNRVFFTPSDRLYACQVARNEGSLKDGLRREELAAEYRSLRSAYEDICGRPVGVPIFFFESLLMVLVQLRLLKDYGLRSANVYDELVVEHKGLYSGAELKAIVETESREVFSELLQFYDTDSGAMKYAV